MDFTQKPFQVPTKLEFLYPVIVDQHICFYKVYNQLGTLTSYQAASILCLMIE
jgi:hypothetical protein